MVNFSYAKKKKKKKIKRIAARGQYYCKGGLELSRRPLGNRGRRKKTLVIFFTAKLLSNRNIVSRSNIEVGGPGEKVRNEYIAGFGLLWRAL